MSQTLVESTRLPLRRAGAGTVKLVSATMDDRTLVRRMLEGDERAFDEFADTYVPFLHRFASPRLDRNPELTREIVQATLVSAISGLRSFRGEAALATWLCACCKREIAAHFRRSRRRPAEVEWNDEHASTASVPDGAPQEGPEDAILRDETTALVHATLELLPPRHGQALEWKYLDNLPVKEIADRMQVSAKAAESLLTRARGSFRETFARLQVGSRHERT